MYTIIDFINILSNLICGSCHSPQASQENWIIDNLLITCGRPRWLVLWAKKRCRWAAPETIIVVVWLRVGSVSKAWNCLGEPDFMNGRSFVILTICVCLPCMGKWMERALLLAGLTTTGHVTHGWVALSLLQSSIICFCPTDERMLFCEQMLFSCLW